MELDLYDVETEDLIDTYIPFLGELRDGALYNPSDSASDMYSKVADMVLRNLIPIQILYSQFYVYRKKCLPV